MSTDEELCRSKYGELYTGVPYNVYTDVILLSSLDEDVEDFSTFVGALDVLRSIHHENIVSIRDILRSVRT
jgi:hypothetical protein